MGGCKIQRWHQSEFQYCRFIFYFDVDTPDRRSIQGRVLWFDCFAHHLDNKVCGLRQAWCGSLRNRCPQGCLRQSFSALIRKSLDRRAPRTTGTSSNRSYDGCPRNEAVSNEVFENNYLLMRNDEDPNNTCPPLLANHLSDKCPRELLIGARMIATFCINPDMCKVWLKYYWQSVTSLSKLHTSSKPKNTIQHLQVYWTVWPSSYSAL